MNEVINLKGLKSFSGSPIFLGVVLALLALSTLPSFRAGPPEASYYLVCVTTYRINNASVIGYYIIPLDTVMESFGSNNTLANFVRKAVESGKNITYLGPATSPIVSEILKASIPECLSKTEAVAGVWIVNGLQQVTNIELTYGKQYAIEAGEKGGNLSVAPTTVTIHTTITASTTTVFTPTVTRSATISSPTQSLPTITTYSGLEKSEGYSSARPASALTNKTIATLIGVAIASLAVLITYELIIRK